MRASLLLFCSILSLSLFAQKGKHFPASLSVDELVDTLWKVAYTGKPVADSIVSELISRGEDGSYKAKVNGLQGAGELLYTRGNLDSALTMYRSAMLLADHQGDRAEAAHCLISMGSVARDQNNPLEALRMHDEAASIWKELQDSSQLCATLIRKAGVEIQFEWMDKAMVSHLEAIECCSKTNDQLFVAHAYNGIATVHKNQKNYEKALEMADSALAIYEKEEEKWYEAMHYNNVGVILKNMKRYQEARVAYAKGLKLMMPLDEEGRYYRAFHTNLAILNNIENRPESAIKHATISYNLNKRFGLTTPMSDCLNEISKALLEKGEPQAALDTINSSIDLAKQGLALEKEKDAYATKSKILSALGLHEAALHAQESYQAISDSMFAKEKTNEISRLQIRFEAEKKDQAINALATQNDLEREKNTWLRLGIGGIALAALFVVFGIIQKRRKDRAVLEGKLALERSEKERLDDQLDHKKRELTEKALHLAQKNELLQGLKKELDLLRTSDVGQDVQAISNKIRFDQQIDNNWEQFTKAFTDTNKGFFDRIRNKHPEVSKSELRLSALLSMHLNSKEIGTILNISDEGVRKARYRLRKRLELKSEDKLEKYLAEI